MRPYIDWESVLMRLGLALFVYCAITAVTALFAGMAQRGGAPFLVQLIIGFGPGIPAAVVCWVQTK